MRGTKKAGHPNRMSCFYGAGNEARTRFRHPADRLRRSAGALPTSGIKKARFALMVEAVSSFARNEKSRTSKPDVLFLWSGQRGSNSLPPPWQGGALPDELCPRSKNDSSKNSAGCQAPAGENPEKSENRVGRRKETALRRVLSIFSREGSTKSDRKTNESLCAYQNQPAQKSAPVRRTFERTADSTEMRFRAARPPAPRQQCCTLLENSAACFRKAAHTPAQKQAPAAGLPQFIRTAQKSPM